jgi:beta-aspartyl-peptidase (threonine type)
VALLRAQGIPIAEAADLVLREVAELGGRGGLIAIDAHGDATMPYLTRTMPRGIWRPGDGATVRVQ